MTEINRRWVLVRRPEGRLKDSDFKRDDQPLPELGPNDVRVRVTHLSFDPTQRIWIQEDSYMPAVPIGAVVRATGIGQVVASNNPNYKPGQLVQGAMGWQDYVQNEGFTEFGPLFPTPQGLTPEQLMGAYGANSITAWFGVHDILFPKEGETALVTGAAGSVGSAAAQILKAAGCKVIGVAGGPVKKQWCVDVAGMDACIDYKNEDVAARIKNLAPDGLDMIFENVGGEILDAGLANLAIGARISLCGAISGYDSDTPESGLKNYMNLVIQRGTMKGFVMLDYIPRMQEGGMAVAALAAQGKLKVEIDMQEGFENIPATLRRLFEGKNIGKQLLKLTDLPLPVA